jgi:hypothetical protein
MKISSYLVVMLASFAVAAPAAVASTNDDDVLVSCYPDLFKLKVRSIEAFHSLVALVRG